MSDNIAIPEYTENGEPVSQERINPNVAQFIMAAAQTAQLVKLRKLEESKVPIGTKSLPLAIRGPTQEVSCSPPWISFQLLNNGPGAIRFSVNREANPLLDEAPVLATQVIRVDFGYPNIHSIFLLAAPNTTANVVIFGKVGKVD